MCSGESAGERMERIRSGREVEHSFCSWPCDLEVLLGGYFFQVHFLDVIHNGNLGFYYCFHSCNPHTLFISIILKEQLTH